MSLACEHEGNRAGGFIAGICQICQPEAYAEALEAMVGDMAEVRPAPDSLAAMSAGDLERQLDAAIRETEAAIHEGMNTCEVCGFHKGHAPGCKLEGFMFAKTESITGTPVVIATKLKGMPNVGLSTDVKLERAFGNPFVMSYDAGRISGISGVSGDAQADVDRLAGYLARNFPDEIKTLGGGKFNVAEVAIMLLERYASFMGVVRERDRERRASRVPVLGGFVEMKFVSSAEAAASDAAWMLRRVACKQCGATVYLFDGGLRQDQIVKATCGTCAQDSQYAAREILAAPPVSSEPLSVQAIAPVPTPSEIAAGAFTCGTCHTPVEFAPLQRTREQGRVLIRWICAGCSQSKTRDITSVI